MLKLKLISLILLCSPIVKTQVATTTQNVMVTLKDYFEPQILAAINKDNNSAKNSENLNPSAGFARTARAKTSSTVKELFVCAIALDASCMVDRAEDIVDNANKNLLRQADAEARHFTSRKEDSPSSLLSTIASLVMELPELLRETFNSFLKQGKLEVRAAEEEEDDETTTEEESAEDSDDEEETEDDTSEDDEEQDVEKQAMDKIDDGNTSDIEPKGGWAYVTRKKCGKKGQNCVMEDDEGDDEGDDYIYGTAGRKVGVDGRGKKKKKKKAITKLLLLGLIIKAKIALLLKLLAAKLQIKFLAIALANLLINLARFWWDLKKGHGEQPQKVIYYEHAQHQHHYDGGEDWHNSSPGGGGYWARAYENEDEKKAAQDLAYAKQAPPGTIYSRVDDKPNISWNPAQRMYL